MAFTEMGCRDSCQDWSGCLAFSKPGWEDTPSGDQVLNPREINKFPELRSSGRIPVHHLPQELLRLFGLYVIDMCLDLGT